MRHASPAFPSLAAPRYRLDTSGRATLRLSLLASMRLVALEDSYSIEILTSGYLLHLGVGKHSRSAANHRL